MRDTAGNYRDHAEQKDRPRGGWSDERVEKLKKLWAQGYSASQIAGALGGTGRNAVIGKIHRLGLSGGVSQSELSKRRAQREASHKPGPLSLNAWKGPVTYRPPMQVDPLPVPSEELHIPLEDRRGVIDLQDKQCRWPIGDPGTPDFHFCSHTKHAAFVYCEFHARKAYQPPRSASRLPNTSFRPAYQTLAPEDLPEAAVKVA